MKDKSGFNLIELMIVVAIIGILAAIAIPIYTNYVYRSKQVEAKTLLMTLKTEQEQYRAENQAYTNDLTKLIESSRLNTSSKWYKVTNPLPFANSTGFRAEVKGRVANDRPEDIWYIDEKLMYPMHTGSEMVY